MSQPPLSQQLKLMEQELSVKLVERVGRSVRLTEAGYILKRRTEQILGLVETTLTELQEFDNGLRGKLSIGTVASLSAAILPEQIRAFHSKYPRVIFQVWEGDTYRITELLDRRLIEIGIVRFPVDVDKYDILRLPAEPLVAVMSHDDDYGETVRMMDLTNKPLMLIRREQGSFIYEMVLEAFQRMGIEPKIICESNDITTLLAWANAGIGVAIIPESALQLFPNTQLKVKRLIEPTLETTSAIIWLRDRYLSTAAKRFIHMFRIFTTNP